MIISWLDRLGPDIFYHAPKRRRGRRRSPFCSIQWMGQARPCLSFAFKLSCKFIPPVGYPPFPGLHLFQDLLPLARSVHSCAAMPRKPGRQSARAARCSTSTPSKLLGRSGVRLLRGMSLDAPGEALQSTPRESGMAGDFRKPCLFRRCRAQPAANILGRFQLVYALLTIQEMFLFESNQLFIR